MGSDRLCNVRLLDGRVLRVPLHAKVTVDDVESAAATHCRLAEVDVQYFGLAYTDDK